MSAIKVTSEELTTVSGSLNSGAAEINDRLTMLESQVKGLVEADWTGAASQSFTNLYEQWHQSALQLRAALEGISTMLAQAATAYQDNEDNLARQLHG